MSLILRTLLLNVEVPANVRLLKQQIDKGEWEAARQTAQALRDNIKEIQKLSEDIV